MRKVPYLYVAMLILIVCMLIPWVVGIVFERNFLSLVEAVNQDSRVEISILEYKRGWLHSHATLKLSLAKDSLVTKTNPTKPLTFIVKEKIIHGPIVYDGVHHSIHFGYALIQSVFHVAEKMNNALPENKNDIGFMQAEAVSKFNGKWKGYIHIPTLNFTTAVGKINLLGLDAEYRLTIRDNLFKHLIVEAKGGTLSLKIDPQFKNISQVTVQPMKFTFDVLHDKKGLWSGNSSVFVPGVSLRRPDGKSYSTDKMTINNKYGMSDGIFYETNVSINIANLKTPSINLQLVPKLQIWLSANNLNGQVFYDHITNLVKGADDAMAILDLKTIEKLLSQSFSVTSILNSEIVMTTQNGELNVKATTKLQPNSPSLSSFNSIINNSLTSATITASIPLTVKIIKIYDETFLNTAPIGDVANTNSNGNIEPQNGMFDALLVQFLKTDKIKIRKAVEITELEKNKFPLRIFSMKLDELGVPPDVAEQLKKIYESSVAASPEMNKTEEKDIRKMIISDQAAQQLIADLEQVGGIVKGDDKTYTTTLTSADGVVKLNGWKIN